MTGFMGQMGKISGKGFEGARWGCVDAWGWSGRCPPSPIFFFIFRTFYDISSLYRQEKED